MTNEPMHPLPPEIWCEPPMAEFQPEIERAPVTTMEPTQVPP
jgi:hypothetical protein